VNGARSVRKFVAGLVGAAQGLGKVVVRDPSGASGRLLSAA